MSNPFTRKENTVSTGFYYDTRLQLICYVYVTEDGEKLIYNRLPKVQQDSMFFIPKNHTKISEISDLDYLELNLNNHDVQISLAYDFNWLHEERLRMETFKDFLEKREHYLILQLLQVYDSEKNIHNTLA